MSHSAYQSSGKPLSAEALYHQRLKQGVFHSPSGTIVGVNSNASDTAALLAASSDLTVKPSYERTIAPEAQVAALAAKQHSIEAWKREKEDPYADAAAASARLPGSTTSSVYTGIPSINSTSMYKAAQQNSSSTMTSRINPEKDIKRTGIQSKQSTGSLNIDKISQLANENSSKSLNSRFNPDLDYRSGLKSRENLAAASAAASLKTGASITDQYSSQTRSNTFKARDIVNSTLLAAANAKANERLDSLKAQTPLDLKQQAQLYAKALAVAQKNSDDRVKQHQAGVINLGGGLTITQTQLDQLASSYVQPILKDIETRADSKRQDDLEKKQQQLELEEAHQRAKQEEVEAKLKEKRDLEAAKQQRVEENEQRKGEEDERYLEYQGGRNKEVDDKGVELKELEDKYTQEREALLAEKQQNQDRIDEEETGKIEARKQELEDMQAERDEELKPTLEELQEANAKLQEVTDARDELKNEYEAGEKLNKEYEEKLAELNKQLEETTEGIEKYSTDLQTSIVKHESTDKEVADLQELHDKELALHEIENKDLDEKLAQLEKDKEAQTTEKANKKKEILDELDLKVKDEQKINNELPEHLRTEIDEGRIRDTGSLFSVEPIKEIPLVKEPQESPSKKETTADEVAAVAASATPVASVERSSSSKRKSFSQRLSSIFKPSSKDKHSNTAISPKKSKSNEAKSIVKDEPATEASNQAKDTRSKSDTVATDFGDIDDLSLNRDENPEKGVFKEDI
ncbi:Eisosome protein 1 [Spathaspora sp. JA1]|nr:Eisosome protein 1 [Spathaspora sp. JA1]